MTFCIAGWFLSTHRRRYLFNRTDDGHDDAAHQRRRDSTEREAGYPDREVNNVARFRDCRGCAQKSAMVTIMISPIEWTMKSALVPRS